jgi:beta-N-acetylhexosaminidase
LTRRLVLLGTFLALLGGAGLTLALLGGGEEPSRAAPKAAPPTATETPQPAPTARPTGPVKTAGGLAARLARSRLAAQVLLVGFAGTEPLADLSPRLTERDLGGVVVEERNYLSALQLATLTGQIQATARAADHLPPVVMAPPGAFADLGPEPRTRAAAEALAAHLQTAGVHAVLGPTLDVGLGDEEQTFGDEPATVTRVGSAVLDGYGDSVGTAPGRFPGEGTAGQDPLRGPASVGQTADQLGERDLEPFRALLPRSGAVVVSNAAFVAFDPVTPGALTPAIVRDLLRDDLRFRGVAIADNVLGAAAATGQTPGQAAVAALAAGCDMVYTRDAEEQRAAYRAIVAALDSGELSEARLREAASRVIEFKRRLGLFAVA